MTAPGRDEDDAALAWDGDEQPAGRPPVEPVETSPTAKPQIPAMLLITYGVIAGIMLIYTIGWIVSVSRSGPFSSALLVEAMSQLGEFLAIASPALWFATIFVLTRESKPLVRLLLLLLGLVIVVPWPFVVGV
jgi:hypothetical protein